jgi:hypothetical protein
VGWGVGGLGRLAKEVFDNLHHHSLSTSIERRRKMK